MFEVPILKSWRSVWERSDPAGYASLRNFAEEVDRLGGRRLQVAEFQRPHIDLPEFGSSLEEWDKQLSSCENAGSNVSVPAISRLAELAADCDDVVHEVHWRRWLELERSLALMLHTGEVLGISILLRSMLDELILALTLEGLRKRMKAAELREISKAESVPAMTYSRLALGRVVSSAATPLHRPSPFTSHKSLRKDPLGILGTYLHGELERTYTRLNNFVHPNAPSHFITFHPGKPGRFNVIFKALN